MSAVGSMTRGVRAGEALLWAGAGILVLSVHVGAAAWFLQEEPVTAADNSPPPAIMIEFAEAPEAAMTEENEISPDQETSQQITQAEEIETPEDVPEEPVEEVAEPEPEEPAEEEPVEEAEAPVEKVEVPLPLARPKLPRKKIEKVEKPEPKPEIQKPRPRRQQQKTASRQQTQAQVQAPQSNRTAARQTSSGLFSSSMTPARWQSRLMAHLERRKRYPASARSRGEKGTVTVRFSIDEGGNVLSVSLARSSGFPELDQEVLSLVRRASPVPAPPPGAQRTITAPVRFSTR